MSESDWQTMAKWKVEAERAKLERKRSMQGWLADVLQLDGSMVQGIDVSFEHHPRATVTVSMMIEPDKWQAILAEWSARKEGARP